MLFKFHHDEPSLWLYCLDRMLCVDRFIQRKGAEHSKVRKALRKSALFATLRLYFADGFAGLGFWELGLCLIKQEMVNEVS